MTRTLKWLAVLTGVCCVAIGLLHLCLGTASVPGEGTAGATVDSRERFYGAIFLGYGLAWIWAARREADRAALVRWLAAILLLGGLGRLLSVAVHGRPQWFQLVLTAIELALPPILFWLAAHSNSADPARRVVAL